MKKLFSNTLYGVGGIYLVLAFMAVLSYIFKFNISLRSWGSAIVLFIGVFIGTFIESKVEK